MQHWEALRNIQLYRWYVTLKDPIFWGPVLIATLQHLGKMSLAEIYFCEAVVLLGFVLLEIPSGALADLIGRRRTLAIGSTLYLGSIVWHTFMTSPFDVWGANIVWMVGATLCSGADKAMLYDSLKVVGREHEYRRIHGDALSRRLALMAAGSLAAGFLGEIHLRLPLALCIPIVAASAVMTFFFREPPAIERYNLRRQWEQMQQSVLIVARSQRLLWIMCFGLIISVAMKAWFFSYNPYFELIEFDMKYWGVLFFCMNIIACLMSRKAHTISVALGERRALILMIALTAIPLLIMGRFVGTLALGAILVQALVRGFRDPFFSDFINRHIEDSSKRATIISINSAFVGLTQFVVLGLFGLALGPWPLPFCLLLLGGATAVLGTFGVFWYNRVFA